MTNAEYRLGIWIERHNLRISIGTWLAFVAAVMLFGLFAARDADAAAPQVTVTLSPSSGTLPYTSTLSWNATGAASCSASGAWSGAKTVSGSQQVTITAAGQTYTLSCAEPVQTATVTWTPATKNSDGTPLTPTGYKLQESIDGASWRNDVTKAATDTSHVWSGLSPGTHYFQIQTVAGSAVSPWLAKGDDGTPVMTTIPVPAIGTGAATGGVVSVPNPPSGFKVTTGVLAYELKAYSNGTLRFVQVGTVEKGAQCPGAKLVGDFYAYDGAKITKPTTGGIIATKCG